METPSRWAPDEKCCVVLTPKTNNKNQSRLLKQTSIKYLLQGQGNLLNTVIDLQGRASWKV
jgi:hypothetical protein